MASWPPKKNAAFTIYLPIVDADGDPVAGAAGLSSTISGDGGAFGAGPVPVDKGEGFYSIALTAANMNFDNISGVLKTTTSGAKNTPFSIYTVARQIDDLAFPNISGRGIDVDATGGAEITPNQNVNVNQWLTATPNVLIAGRVDANAQVVGDKTGYSLTTAEEDAIVNKVWDELTAEARTAGSYGQKLKDFALTAAGRVDLGLWLGVAPNALIAGRVDANAQVVGDKTGYSVGTGGIAATSFAAGAIDAAAIAADAIGAAELAADAANEIADAILNRNVAGGSSTGRLVKQALYVLRNRVNMPSATAIDVYQTDDLTIEWSGVVTTAAGNPITQIDPA